MPDNSGGGLAGFKLFFRWLGVRYSACSACLVLRSSYAQEKLSRGYHSLHKGRLPRLLSLAARQSSMASLLLVSIQKLFRGKDPRLIRLIYQHNQLITTVSYFQLTFTGLVY